MSYSVLLDGRTIHDPTLQDRAYIVFEPVLTQEANLIPTFTFTVYPGHALYNAPALITSKVEVFDGDVSIFLGRILNAERGWNNDKTFTCEGELGYLNDTVVRPYSFGGTPTQYLQQLIDGHNAQVDAGRHITVRQVTVTDPNDYIVRGNVNYPSTWQEITEKCTGIMGGYLMAERVNGVLYLDWLENSPWATTQHIEFAINLLDLGERVKGEDIITGIIPLGARIEDDSGEEGERLTIESVNDGLDYLLDNAAVQKYGVILDTAVWDDITTPSMLKLRGAQRLQERIAGTTEIELTAADLSVLNADIQAFRFLDYVRVVSEPHGIDTHMIIRKLVTDISVPENSVITIGAQGRGLSWYVAENRQRTETILKDYVVNDQMRSVAEDVNSLHSQIIQTASDILLEVGETYVANSEYNSRIEQMTSEILLNAKNIAMRVTESQYNTERPIVSPEAPEQNEEGRLWLDTAVEPSILKEYRNGQWVTTGAAYLHTAGVDINADGVNIDGATVKIITQLLQFIVGQNNGQRLDIGTDEDGDPYVHIYNNNDKLAIALEKDGIYINELYKFVEYKIGTWRGVGTYVG